jgi:hypothetical protein
VGWVRLQLHFKEDCGEKPVEMHHPLKLYEDQASQDRQSTKKPVRARSFVALHKTLFNTIEPQSCSVVCSATREREQTCWGLHGA